MFDIKQLKHMIKHGGVALNVNLEQRILNDEMTDDDHAFVSKAFGVMRDQIDFPDNKPIQWVMVEVIKEVGYHDAHRVGAIINIDREHLDEMIEYGYVRVLKEDHP